MSQDAEHWIRLFNRLEAAVSRHRGAKEGTGFTDDADDALHHAHRQVLKAAAKGKANRNRPAGGGHSGVQIVNHGPTEPAVRYIPVPVDRDGRPCR